MPPDGYTVLIYAGSWLNESEWELARAIQVAENKRLFLVFSKCQKPNLEPNLLAILMRAVNGLKLCQRIIFQPRWKCGRWKSKT